MTVSKTLQFAIRKSTDETTIEGEYSGQPLILQQCWDRVQRRYEALICTSDPHSPGCFCPILEDHYGARLFKCKRLACAYSREGFSTKSGRDHHAKSHMRSFKCGFKTCSFATIGFFSESQLNQHTEVFHMKDKARGLVEGADVDLAQETLEQIMLDAVELGETDSLNAILDKFPQPPLNFLVHIAYLKGSKADTLGMLKNRGADIDDRDSLQLLAKVGDRDPAIPAQIWTAMVRIREEYNIFQISSEHRRAGIAEGPQTALTEAVEGGSIECVRWVLEQGVNLKEKVLDNKLFVTALDYLFARQLTRSRDKRSHRPLPQDIIEILLESGSEVEDGRSLHSLIQCQFLPEEQTAYLDTAKLLLKHGSSVRTDALHFVVGSNHSCELAQLLIEYGADIEAPYTTGDPKSPTPLQRCIKYNHRKAAEFARFLLESGAKTQLRANDYSKNPDFKLDPKKFAKWTGQSWDELVLQVQSAQSMAGLPHVDFDQDYPRPK